MQFNHGCSSGAQVARINPVFSAVERAIKTPIDHTPNGAFGGGQCLYPCSSVTSVVNLFCLSPG